MDFCEGNSSQTCFFIKFTYFRLLNNKIVNTLSYLVILIKNNFHFTL